MTQKVLIKGEALHASVVSALAAEQFLNNNYLFRRNVMAKWSLLSNHLAVRNQHSAH